MNAPRIGSIVKCNAAFGRNYLGQLGVVTTIGGSRGTAGFKFVAWERQDGERFVHYVEGDFTYLLKSRAYASLTTSERSRIDRIKAYIAENKRPR